MTVENPEVVDVVGIDEAGGEVVLTIADHLHWDDTESHLQALQSKLNAYLAFVETGELLEQYPDAVGRAIRIDVVLMHEPPALVEQFFTNARTTVASAGFTLGYRVLNS